MTRRIHWLPKLGIIIANKKFGLNLVVAVMSVRDGYRRVKRELSWRLQEELAWTLFTCGCSGPVSLRNHLWYMLVSESLLLSTFKWLVFWKVRLLCNWRRGTRRKRTVVNRCACTNCFIFLLHILTLLL